MVKKYSELLLVYRYKFLDKSRASVSVGNYINDVDAILKQMERCVTKTLRSYIEIYL